MVTKQYQEGFKKLKNDFSSGNLPRDEMTRNKENDDIDVYLEQGCPGNYMLESMV
jgi:hypothetical protein